jgi:hypothetical protein
MREPMHFRDFRLNELSDDQVRILYDSMYYDFVLVRGEYLRRGLHRTTLAENRCNAEVKIVTPNKQKRRSIRFITEVTS